MLDTVNALLQPVGLLIRDVILSSAELLKHNYVPGLLSLLILVFLLGVTCWCYFRWLRPRNNALATLQAALAETDGEREFHQHRFDIDQRVREQLAHKPAKEAWLEYGETLFEDTEGSVYRNGIRPQHYFNAEDLDCDFRRWRVWPPRFVSVGLALTFLGLIAALQTTSETLQAGVDASDALTVLLTVASAKFIMSLTGLVCSIVLAWLISRWSYKLDDRIHKLNRTIEERVAFVGLEQLADEQLKAIHEQKETAQKLTTQLIAEIGQPLKEDVPRAIAESISKAMTPVANQITQASTDGVGDIVGKLSDKLTQTLGDSLQNTSHSIESAGTRLENLVKTTGEAGKTMNTDMETASKALNEAADKLSSVAKDLAENISSNVTEKTDITVQNINDSLNENGNKVAAKLAEAAMRMASKLNDPFTELSSTVNRLNNNIETSSNRYTEYANAIKAGTSATEKANSQLADASATLNKASQPMRDFTQVMVKAIENLEGASSNTSTALSSQKELVLNSLNELKILTERYQHLAERHDTIDVKLGAAFELYEKSVTKAVQTVERFSSEVHTEYAGALATLQSVIQDAKDFSPASRH